MRRNVKRKEDFLKRRLGYSKSVRQEQEVKTFKCDQCQNTCTTERDIKNHMEKHMRSLNNLIKVLRLNKLKAMERKVLKTPEEHKKYQTLIEIFSVLYGVSHMP